MSVLVQLASFVSSVVLAMTLGATTMTDAYYLALSVPLLAYAVLNVAARLGAIPGLTKLAHTKPHDEVENAAQELISAWLTTACVLSVLVTLVMFAILPVVAGGSPRLSSLTRLYIVELAPYAVTGALLGALGAVLAVRGRFAITTFVLTFEPVCKSALVLLFHRQLGAQALVIGSVFGNALAVAVLWTALRRSGVTIHLRWGRPTPWVRSVLKFSIPLIVSQSVLQFNPVIDRVAAAGLGSGNVTVMQFGLKVFTAPASIVTAILIAPLTATWSARFTTEGWDAVVRSFARVVSGILLVVPPLIVIGFIVRHDLVQVVYQSHRYGPRAVGATANVMGMLMLGFIPEILIPPLASLFIIRGDTMFPLKVGITNAVLNGVLDFALRGPLGVAGIALSTSLTLAVLCAMYVRKAHQRWGSLGLRKSARTLILSGPSSVAIGLLCVEGLGLPWLGHGRLTALLAVISAVAVALLVHGVVLGMGRSTVRALLPGTWLPRVSGPGALAAAVRRR